MRVRTFALSRMRAASRSEACSSAADRYSPGSDGETRRKLSTPSWGSSSPADETVRSPSIVGRFVPTRGDLVYW
eukprot:scaffold17259_cov35-Tisochrysis_lutea.AAC.2